MPTDPGRPLSGLEDWTDTTARSHPRPSSSRRRVHRGFSRSRRAGWCPAAGPVGSAGTTLVRRGLEEIDAVRGRPVVRDRRARQAGRASRRHQPQALQAVCGERMRAPCRDRKVVTCRFVRPTAHGHNRRYARLHCPRSPASRIGVLDQSQRSSRSGRGHGHRSVCPQSSTEPQPRWVAALTRAPAGSRTTLGNEASKRCGQEERSRGRRRSKECPEREPRRVTN